MVRRSLGLPDLYFILAPSRSHRDGPGRFCPRQYKAASPSRMPLQNLSPGAAAAAPVPARRPGAGLSPLQCQSSAVQPVQPLVRPSPPPPAAADPLASSTPGPPRQLLSPPAVVVAPEAFPRPGTLTSAGRGSPELRVARIPPRRPRPDTAAAPNAPLRRMSRSLSPRSMTRQVAAPPPFMRTSSSSSSLLPQPPPQARPTTAIRTGNAAVRVAVGTSAGATDAVRRQPPLVTGGAESDVRSLRTAGGGIGGPARTATRIRSPGAARRPWLRRFPRTRSQSVCHTLPGGALGPVREKARAMDIFIHVHI
jgi:hypothetical protein